MQMSKAWRQIVKAAQVLNFEVCGEATEGLGNVNTQIYSYYS